MFNLDPYTVLRPQETLKKYPEKIVIYNLKSALYVKTNFDRENPSFLTFQVQQGHLITEYTLLSREVRGHKLDERYSCAKSGITSCIRNHLSIELKGPRSLSESADFCANTKIVGKLYYD